MWGALLAFLVPIRSMAPVRSHLPVVMGAPVHPRHPQVIFARPPADGVSEKQQQSSSPPFLRSSVKELPLALAKGLRRAPDPGNFRGSNSISSFLRFFFPCYFLTPYLLRFSSQHDPILDPKLAPISHLLPFFFRSPCQFDFRPHFGPFSDPKSIPNSIKNQSKNSSNIDLQTHPISGSSSIKFRRQSHVQAKWSMFKNRSKTLCFCMFFEHPLMPTKANTRHATH